ncbi:alkaline phosphatase family protein [Nannocystaceae bacterium ST9]
MVEFSLPRTLGDFRLKLVRPGRLRVVVEGVVGRDPETHTYPKPRDVRVQWTLKAPNGAVVPLQSDGAGLYLDVDDRIIGAGRDGRGTVTKSHTLTIEYQGPLVEDAHLLAWITEYAIDTPPLLDGVVALSTTAPATVAMDVQRFGTLRCTVANVDPSALRLSILGPRGELLATSTGSAMVEHEHGLASPRNCTLRIELLRGPLTGVRVSAQVFAHRSIALSVIQQRLLTMFGTGKNLSIRAIHEPIAGLDDWGEHANSIYLTVHDARLFDTLKLLDVWQSIEKSVATAQAKDGLGPPDHATLALGQPFRLRRGLAMQEHEDVSVFSVDPWVELHLRSEQLKLGLTVDAATKAPTIHFTLDPAANENRVGLTGVAPTITVLPGLTVDARLAIEGGCVVVRASAKVPISAAIQRAKIQAILETKAVNAFESALVYGIVNQLIATLLGGYYYLTGIRCEGDRIVFEHVAPEDRDPVPSPAYRSPAATTSSTSKLALGLVHGGETIGSPRPWSSPNLDKIDRIVVLMMENRSFDHVLGHLSLAGRKDVDGLTPEIIAGYAPYTPKPLAGSKFHLPVCHGRSCVDRQMADRMHGFVADFVHNHPFLLHPEDPAQWPKDDEIERGTTREYLRANYGPASVMGYHTPATLPVYAFLAREYGICDRWFCSHPGPTWPNRFYLLRGDVNRDEGGQPYLDNPTSFKLFRERTLFDALTRGGVSWAYYESPPDVTMLRTFTRFVGDVEHVRPLTEFLAAARAGSLPSVSFVDPSFFVAPANDDHPTTDMANGQELVKGIYEALIANPAAWAKTLFVITYDEHGGFFDHVEPPLAETWGSGLDAVSVHYGVRVPTFVVSPWVERGSCDKTLYDHTSIARTILQRFFPGERPFVSDRILYANDLGSSLTRASPRPAVGYPPPVGPRPKQMVINPLPATTDAPTSRLGPIVKPLPMKVFEPPRIPEDFHGYVGMLGLLRNGEPGRS